MSVALIAVDVQYDFLPGGSLGAPNGDRIIHPIILASRDATLFIASRDWHPANHFSFSDDPLYIDGSWPPHCVQGTKGARIYPSIRRRANFVISKGMSVNGPDQYSAFAGKTLRPVQSLEQILDRSPITTVIVTGLILEFCVGFTALDANALGYRTVVPLNTTTHISDDARNAMLDKLTTAGVEVVSHWVS